MILLKTCCFCYREVIPRAVSTVKLPTQAAQGLALGILGTALGCLSLATLGTFESVNNKSYACLSSFQCLFANNNENLLKIINPQASSSDYKKDGLITHLAKIIFWKIKYNPGDHFFKREIATRLSYALHLLASVISRVVDIMIGSVLSAIALLTLGTFPILNTCTYKALQITGVVKDFFYCSVKIINPNAKFSIDCG